MTPSPYLRRTGAAPLSWQTVALHRQRLSFSLVNWSMIMWKFSQIRNHSLATLLGLTALAGCSGDGAPLADADARRDSALGPAAAVVTTAAVDYNAPPDSTIPDDALGVAIRRGRALILRTTDSLPEYATGNIQCASCHLDAGRRRDAAPLTGVYARFPKYMERTGAVIPLEDRVNYCFTRSLAGNRLPNDSREMQDIIAYLAFLSRGVPVGAHVIGEGMPKLAKLTGDSARGGALFATTCALCHGAEGQGMPPAFPALWGSKSYSIGASMAREERAATFIRHFMPQTKPGSLTDQQAYDLAAYINSHPRPDSPGKENDWPKGGADADVPYRTQGHEPYRPPSRLLPRATPGRAIVLPPASVRAARRSAVQ